MHRKSGNALLGIALATMGSFQQRWWEVLPRAEWAELTRVDIEQPVDWFEVYVAADGALAIYEPGYWEEAIAYLIVGTERALLFDTLTGMGNLHDVVAQLTALPVVVVNSHSHYDHVGDNHRFEIVFAPDSDYTRHNAVGIEHDQALRFIPDGSIRKPTPPGFDPDRWKVERWETAGTLSDGDVIDLGDRQLEVLLTPGHAPDALCLLDRANGLLFTGDTYYRGPLFAHLPGSDLDLYAATTERLAELRGDVRVLLPGHNTTAVPADDLIELHDAFRQVLAGDAAFEESDGVREYSFAHSTVRVRVEPSEAP